MKKIIFTLAIVVSGMLMQAQTLDEYKQDTLWLRSGEVIPCMITADPKTKKIISISYRNEKGNIVYDQIPKKEISRYKRKGMDDHIYIENFKVELKDGTVLTGNIMSEDETSMEIHLADIGLLTIDKDKIKRIVPLDASKDVRKSYWFENPHATRLLFAPTAIPLKRGEGYYQNIYIVGNMFNYGVLNNLSIGGGFDFITMFIRTGDGWHPMLNFNIKSGFRVSENFHAGVGGLYVTILDEFSAGILYGLGTIGSYNTNLTLGLGWGFVDGTFEAKPFIMIGGMARISEKLWFVSENWIAPVNNDSKYYPVFSYGLRFAAKRIAVDLAFINSKDIFEGIVIGVPFVDFVIKLGK